jgi:hypothetical protein
MLRGACESWIRKLFIAAKSSNEDYLHQTEIVLKECDSIHNILRTVPKHILEDLIPELERHFLDMIMKYDQSIRASEISPWDEETHNNMCTSMLRSVLPSKTEVYDTLDISSRFAHSLVIQTLDSVPY